MIRKNNEWYLCSLEPMPPRMRALLWVAPCLTHNNLSQIGIVYGKKANWVQPSLGPTPESDAASIMVQVYGTIYGTGVLV